MVNIYTMNQEIDFKIEKAAAINYIIDTLDRGILTAGDLLYLVHYQPHYDFRTLELPEED